MQANIKRRTYKNTIGLELLPLMYNIRSSAKRQVIDKWAHDNNVDLVMLTETYHPHSSQEQSKHYFWFFGSKLSQDDSAREIAGVAIMLPRQWIHTLPNQKKSCARTGI